MFIEFQLKKLKTGLDWMVVNVLKATAHLKAVKWSVLYYIYIYLTTT